MFSGIGGFDLALQNLGHEIVGACEIDRYARQVYSRHFSGVHIHDDATTLQAESLPYFDLLCAGFPCQAFSVAGKKLGFDDSRGTLFFEIARIAKEKRPRYLLLENVRGLLFHDKGQTMRTIIGIIDELGYDAEWQVINSKYFVPQNRERVFIIGHLRGEPTRQVFPIGQTGEKSNQWNTKEQVANTLQCPGHSCGNYRGMNMIVVKQDKSQAARFYDSKGISQTISANGGGWGAKTGLYTIPVRTPDRLKKRQNGRRFKEDGEPAFTLTSQDRHGIFDGKHIRRLTPLECERLQGFPDNWTDGISNTQRYKCLGNAVTVPVVEYIASHLTFGEESQ